MSNKGKRIYLIIIWVITLIVILFGIYRFVGSGSWNIFSFESGKYVEKTEDLSADITELDVDVHSANVIIEEGDAPSIWYSFPEDADVSILNENGKVSFRENSNNNNFVLFGNGKKKEVKITVPKDRQLMRINTKTHSGNVDIHNVKCDDIITNQDSGNLKISSVASRNLKTDADSGNIIVDSNIENVVAEADSGNIEFDGNIEKINVKADSGNINLKGDYHIIDAKADSGNITIDSKRPESEMVLNLDVDSGKITVNGNKYKN